MKKLLILTLAVILALALTACGMLGAKPNKAGGVEDIIGNVVGKALSEALSETNAQGGNSVAPSTNQDIENKVMLTLDKVGYERDERIDVTLDFSKLDKDNAIIAIVSSDTPHGNSNDILAEGNNEAYRYLADFTELPFCMWAPDKDGFFDVRVFSHEENGEELACVTIAVGDTALNDLDGVLGDALGGILGGTLQGASGGDIGNESGMWTREQMEDRIVSYFAPVSGLTELSICGGEIYYYTADDMIMTVDVWTISNPDMSYDELVDSLNAQLSAAGFDYEANNIGAHVWSIPVGESEMFIELRPFYEGDTDYTLYATPKA